MPNFFVNVLCYPYSFPFGIINEYLDSIPFLNNYIDSIPFCYDETHKGLDINKKKNKDIYHTFDTTEDKDRLKKDMKSGVKLDIMNQKISNIIKKNSQFSSTTQITDQTATIKNQWIDTSDKNTIDEQVKRYQDILKNHKRPFYNKKTKKLEYVQSYFCNTNVHQTSNEKIVKINKIDSKDKEEIVNHVRAHVVDHLQEMGAEEVAIKASARTIDKMHNTLLNQIDTTVEQVTHQLSIVSSNIHYIDRYGYCDIERDIKNPNYGKPKGKKISQKSQLKSISKNISNQSIDIIMKNKEMVDIISKIKINRVDNWVVIASIILDIICFIICFWIIKSLFFPPIDEEKEKEKIMKEFENYDKEHGTESKIPEGVSLDELKNAQKKMRASKKR